MKRVAWYIGVIAITLLILILLWQFSISIVLFALSLAVSSALKPLINRIAGKIKSKRIALGLVYSAIITIILLLVLVGGQFLLEDIQRATDDFIINYERIKTHWPNSPSYFRQTLGEQLPSSTELSSALISEEGITKLMVNGWPGKELFSNLGYFAIVLVLSIYWNTDHLRFERTSVNLFPANMRPKALHIWRSIEEGVGSYLESEIIQSTLAGLILGLGFWLIGLRYPVLMGLWGAIARLIPWFGVLLAVLPLLFFGGSFLSVKGFLTIFFALSVLILLKKVIEPRLNQGSKNSLLIVIFVIVLAEAFGFIGILLAPPLAVAVQIILQELYPVIAQKKYSLELQEAFKLKKRLSRVRKDIKGPASSEPMQYVNQLYQLVRQTISYMQKY